MQWKNKLYFEQEEMLKWLDTPRLKVFGHAICIGTGFEAVHSDISELWAPCMHYCKLLIIGLHLEYFATLLKRLHLEKIAAKCSIFLH